MGIAENTYWVSFPSLVIIKRLRSIWFFKGNHSYSTHNKKLSEKYLRIWVFALNQLVDVDVLLQYPQNLPSGRLTQQW